MKAYFLITGTGPLVILTSYDSITSPALIEKLNSKGISKFIAREISVDTVKSRYGHHFEVVCQDLHEADDLRVLDYDGHRVFKSFAFSELGTPIYHEPA